MNLLHFLNYLHFHNMIWKHRYIMISCWTNPNSEASLHRLLQLCAHLAVFPVCRSASLPRVPLCCHVWKQAFALMYNTSLDPRILMWLLTGKCGGEAVAKRCSLRDNCSRWATKTTCLAFYLWNGVRVCLLVLLLGLGTTTTHSLNVICWCGWTVIVLLHKYYCRGGILIGWQGIGSIYS